MTRKTTTASKHSTGARNAAKVVIAGLVVGAPMAIFASPASAAGNDWDAVAQCESTGNWSINSGNGFSGGLQFTPSTWKAFGGSGSAHNASKSEQIAVAERVLAGQGKGAWPVCGKNLGSGNASASSSTAKATTKSAPKAQAPKAATTQKAQAPKASAAKAQAPKASTAKAQAPKASAAKAQAPKASTAKAQAPKASAAKAQAPKASSAKATTKAKAAKSSGKTYTVKSGDTLSSIASTQGVSGGYQALFSINKGKISNPNMIFAGQTLTLA
ncbi:transglycosylase family protein [Rhodococcus sp. X156]|uniref:transglycosylase family protein n=1 Tax=Rhodococcus sp. X156 TaxID=2499145 RepID=UPI0013E38F9A|nr:transglycosylase family protein [Rhodococcus sp. X156]